MNDVQTHYGKFSFVVKEHFDTGRWRIDLEPRDAPKEMSQYYIGLSLLETVSKAQAYDIAKSLNSSVFDVMLSVFPEPISK